MKGVCHELKDRLTDLKSQLAVIEQGRGHDAVGPLNDPAHRQGDELRKQIDTTQQAFDACMNQFRIIGYVQQQRRQGLR